MTSHLMLTNDRSSKFKAPLLLSSLHQINFSVTVHTPGASYLFECIFCFGKTIYIQKKQKGTKRKTRQAKALENARKAPRNFLELLHEWDLQALLAADISALFVGSLPIIHVRSVECVFVQSDARKYMMIPASNRMATHPPGGVPMVFLYGGSMRLNFAGSVRGLNGTLTLEGLLRLEVNAIALFVSLKPGSRGKIGVDCFPFFALQGAVLYSRIAVVVVLSKGSINSNYCQSMVGHSKEEFLVQGRIYDPQEDCFPRTHRKSHSFYMSKPQQKWFTKKNGNFTPGHGEWIWRTQFRMNDQSTINGGSKPFTMSMPPQCPLLIFNCEPWRVTLYLALLTALITRLSPSRTSNVGPGNSPFTVIVLWVLHSLFTGLA
ncbi:hypothetical protein SADUNF_Sadunf13G0118000 [Salix dunnii]|uniref:Uncharacterized protein n=1 Tax=Salix dunnii TaxID=1413687 RepID=A0A835JLT3_9ROSI|nr:hypothetical protein SADUNF_Sadunf13G0118000 [Salix dunnii]